MFKGWIYQEITGLGTNKQTKANKIKEIIQDLQYEMDIMTLFNKIKGETIKLVDINNNPDIYAVN